MKRLSLQLLFALFGAAALSAQSAPPTATVFIRSGAVEVQRENVWVPVAAGESLNAGDRIRTGKASNVAIEIGSGSVVTVRELSQVQIVPSSAGLAVRLEAGDMKQLLPPETQAPPKETIAVEAPDRQLILELRDQVDRLNRTLTNGSAPPEQPVIEPAYQYRPMQQLVPESPIYYVYPDPSFFFAPDPTDGRITPPVVRNPTNPGYRPTQIVPPMSDPIRVPVVTPLTSR